MSLQSILAGDSSFHSSLGWTDPEFVWTVKDSPYILFLETWLG